MKLYLVTASIFIFTCSPGISAEKCSDVETRVPRHFKLDQPDSYMFLEAALQIFTELRVECDGLLTQWRFVASNPFIYALHLGVFRQRSARPLVFDLVAESHLSALSTPDGVSGIWVYYPTKEPLHVKEGDFLGVFYDKFAISMEMLTIPNKNEVNFGKISSAKTYIMLIDNLTLRQNKTVDASKAAVAYRKPALSAVISPLSESVTTEESLPSASTPTTMTPMEKLKNSKVKGTSDSRRRPLAYTTSTTTTTTTTTSTMPPTTTSTPPTTITTEEQPTMPQDNDNSSSLPFIPPPAAYQIECNGWLCWPAGDYEQ